MKNKNYYLNELATLAVKVGANVQPNQSVVIRSSIEAAPLVRKISECAYKTGAKKVHVVYSDSYLSKLDYDYMSIEDLGDFPSYVTEQYKSYIEEGACFISVLSPNPDLLSDVNSDKLNASAMANYKNLGFFSEYLGASKTQWTIVAYPNEAWASKVFPDLSKKEAYDKLFSAILSTSRVSLNHRSVSNWKTHNENLLNHNKILNSYDFKTLHFKNSLGTDLEIGLVDDHIWCGGGEHNSKGVYFNPNIPTEENFTMPDKNRINGVVYASLPLAYQGKLIENFYLEFKDGKIINYKALKNEAVLKDLIDTDEGSHSLGEVALVGNNSPISNLGILFYNTLFDENASCHLAIGRAYPMNIKGGITNSREWLEQRANTSKVHVDFMFGSPDMKIVGTTKDGKLVDIFIDGNFVI